MKRTGHPKREDGYTMIFNELLEALMCADIPKRARRLIDVQMRFSFGCGPKTFTALTTKDFAMLSSLDLSNARKAISWLVKNDIFEPDAGNHGRYRLNKFYHLWKVRVPLRDDPAYKDLLWKAVGRQVNFIHPDEVKTTYPAKVKTTPKLSGDVSVIGQNDLKKEVETTQIDRSKQPKIFADSPSVSSTCDLLKKKKRKGKENKDYEEVYSYFFCRDLADLLDGHPFFSGLKTDADFWNALAAAFPDQDIPMQINRMTAWLIANPNKRYKNYKRFIQGWLSRAERKENDHGKTAPEQRRGDRDDSQERPAPFSDIPPELIA